MTFPAPSAARKDELSGECGICYSFKLGEVRIATVAREFPATFVVFLRRRRPTLLVTIRTAPNRSTARVSTNGSRLVALLAIVWKSAAAPLAGRAQRSSVVRDRVWRLSVLLFAHACHRILSTLRKVASTCTKAAAHSVARAGLSLRAWRMRGCTADSSSPSKCRSLHPTGVAQRRTSRLAGHTASAHDKGRARRRSLVGNRAPAL